MASVEALRAQLDALLAKKAEEDAVRAERQEINDLKRAHSYSDISWKRLAKGAAGVPSLEKLQQQWSANRWPGMGEKESETFDEFKARKDAERKAKVEKALRAGKNPDAAAPGPTIRSTNPMFWQQLMNMPENELLEQYPELHRDWQNARGINPQTGRESPTRMFKKGLLTPEQFEKRKKMRGVTITQDKLQSAINNLTAHLEGKLAKGTAGNEFKRDENDIQGQLMDQLETINHKLMEMGPRHKATESNLDKIKRKELLKGRSAGKDIFTALRAEEDLNDVVSGLEGTIEKQPLSKEEQMKILQQIRKLAKKLSDPVVQPVEDEPEPAMPKTILLKKPKEPDL